MLANSCGKGNDSVKSFAQKFAGYVNEEVRDSIIALYPGAEYADKIEINFNPDSLTVTPTDKEGEYLVSYCDGEKMLVSTGKNGEISIVESNGLFKYSPAKMQFAEKVGALKKNMNDETLAKRMIQVDNLSSELFNEYVNSRKNAIKNLGFTVTHDPQFAMEEGTGYFTLKNTTDQPIGGDEYDITYWVTDMSAMSEYPKIEPGKDISANGSIKLNESFTWRFGRDIKAITMHTPSIESFFKNYAPTGEEYDNYVKIHGKEVKKKVRPGIGPFELAGKLGNKYPIHINLAKGMKAGTYYYDKNGPKATLDLRVKAYNENTGELTIEESNNKGEVTGTFVGILTPEAYIGTMTSFQGKTYDFTLEVIK